MSDLNVQNIGTDRNVSLVVDSRLISEVLGVDHGPWMNNVVKKYQAEIEEDFGKVYFQNGPSQKGQMQGYALLTEDQATCLMTYSKNTEQVRAAKRNLVKAFSKAKDLLLQGARVEPVPLKLAPPIERIASLKASLEFFGIDAENPRFKQGLQDLTLDVLGVSNRHALPGNTEQWCGVAERSEQLGIAPLLVTKYRSKLGKAIKPLVPSSDRREERRLCNGTLRLINLYRVSDALDSAIQEYFSTGEGAT